MKFLSLMAISIDFRHDPASACVLQRQQGGCTASSRLGESKLLGSRTFFTYSPNFSGRRCQFVEAWILLHCTPLRSVVGQRRRLSSASSCRRQFECFEYSRPNRGANGRVRRKSQSCVNNQQFRCEVRGWILYKDAGTAEGAVASSDPSRLVPQVRDPAEYSPSQSLPQPSAFWNRSRALRNHTKGPWADDRARDEANEWNQWADGIQVSLFGMDGQGNNIVPRSFFA